MTGAAAAHGAGSDGTPSAQAGTAPASVPEAAGLRLEPMQVAHLDAVMDIERRAYDFPWSRGNFIDSLAAGHPAWRLLDAGGRLLGYYVALRGVGEMHLLNLTVAPGQQGRGHARRLLAALIDDSRAAGLGSLWLEVRAGNRRARALYARSGFAEVGVRRSYYPALHDAATAGGALAVGAASREDAVVMTLDIGGPP